MLKVKRSRDVVSWCVWGWRGGEKDSDLRRRPNEMNSFEMKAVGLDRFRAKVITIQSLTVSRKENGLPVPCQDFLLNHTAVTWSFFSCSARGHNYAFARPLEIL